MADSLWQDLRFGFHLLYKNLRLTLVLLFCLILGIGPNATLFGIVNNALLRPLDIEEPERLVALCSTRLDSAESMAEARKTARPILTYPDLEYLARKAETLSHVVGQSGTRVTLQADGAPHLVRVSTVSSNFFDSLGRRAMLGKTFYTEDLETPGSQPYLVLSHALWIQLFAGDSKVVGREVRVNGFPFRILGVMGPEFTGASLLSADLWSPILMTPQLRPGQGERLRQEDHRWVASYARLAPGATAEDADRELEMLARQLAEQKPATHETRMFFTKPYNNLGGYELGTVGRILSVVLLLVGAVLLVACSSVGSLLLARSTVRRQEIAMRLALGATRARLIRQLLTENFLLALIGGVLGLLASFWTMDLMGGLIADGPLPFALRTSLDWRVLLYTLGLAVLATLIFGLAPALQATKGELLPALKDQPGGLGSEFQVSKLRNAFMVIQFAVSIMLLIVAGLFVRSLKGAKSLDPGFETHQLLLFTMEPSLYGYLGDEIPQFTQSFRESLKGVPGVEGVSVSRLGPLSTHRTFARASKVADDLTTGESIRVGYNYVSPGYFEINGIELVKGRFFHENDELEEAPVCIINETLARRCFGDEDPLDQFLSVFMVEAARVVGVVRDSKYWNIGEDPVPFIYVPVAPIFDHEATFAVRVSQDPEVALNQVVAALGTAFPELILEDFTTIQARLARSLQPIKMAAAAFAGLGLLALILAMIGVYGIISYSVNLRKQEVGVRLALGAAPRHLVFLLMKRGLMLVCLGLVIGLVGALALGGFIKPMLAGVSPYDARAFLFPTLFLTLVALAALLFPARRIVGQEPMRALRYE